MYIDVKKWGVLTQSIVFFFPGKVRFCALLGEIEWMNENVGCFFFFQPPEKQNSFEIEWMANELFRDKKKKQKKFPEIFWKRQKINLFYFSACLEKKTRFSDLNEWMANEFFQEKKIRYLWLTYTRKVSKLVSRQ